MIPELGQLALALALAVALIQGTLPLAGAASARSAEGRPARRAGFGGPGRNPTLARGRAPVEDEAWGATDG